MHTWQLQEAKARLSEVLKRAASEGPQEITLRGQPAAVVMTVEEYQRLTRTKPTFVEFMRNSPWTGADLELERDTSPDRDLEL